MLEVPTLLVEVMSSTSAMAPRCRSNGVATVLAMTSGLAPGSCADTNMAGTSIRGSGATGNSMKATAPHSATPTVKSVVATGLRMNGADIFMWDYPQGRRGLVGNFVREIAWLHGRTPNRSPE